MATYSNYAATVAVATASYPATAQYIPTCGGSLCIDHSGNVSNLITFSFDGTTDHGYVMPGTSKTLTFNVYGPVWFKGAAATSTTLYVATELRQ